MIKNAKHRKVNLNREDNKIKWTIKKASVYFRVI